jgi:transposase
MTVSDFRCRIGRRQESKVALGFVEGFNNKIRVFQRRADGPRDEDLLRVKIVTCALLEL